MKTSQAVIPVGAAIHIGGHRVSRTTEHGVTFDFNGPVTLRDRVDINAAIKPTGFEVANYWRMRDANGKAVLCVNGYTQHVPAVGKVIASPVAVTPTTTIGGPTGTVNTPTATPPTVQTGFPSQPPSTLPVAPQPVAPQVVPEVVLTDDEPEYVTEEDAKQGHRYIPAPSLVKLFASMVRGVKAGRSPRAMLFLGPSGSGKGDGAQHLANTAGLPFLKVDAASIGAPEDWFGTREVVAKDGVSVTVYSPSAFILHIQQPGFTLIDEANRIQGPLSNPIMPLMDGSRRVTNPLTGQVIQMHPEHYLALAGNRGLVFTSTFAMDPALLNRCRVVPFDYLASDDEIAVAMEATGCDLRTATLFVRFANEVRAQVKAQDALGGTDLLPVSTRQVIAACESVADGLDVDEAVAFNVINHASDEGGAQSMVQTMKNIWTGIRPTYDADPTATK